MDEQIKKMTKKYQIIYCDPPWRYDHQMNTINDIENKYPTLSDEELKKLIIPCEKDSVIYLWTTSPKLYDALKLLEHWGFLYRSCMVWDKVDVGLGYWFRQRHELLLVGKKGNFPAPPEKQRIESILISKKGRHSAKPTIIRELISRWYPDATKLEMFARPDERIDLWGKNTFAGWDVWGNEVESNIKI
jgi:N6-adenosine-specific RNA methylase IME4